MTTTIIGLFDGCSDAQRIIQTLVAQGVWPEDMTIIVNREATSVSDALAVAAWGVNVEVGPASQGQPAALIALGVPADQTQEYAMGVGGGGVLVSVMAADDQADQALEVMGRYTTEALEAQAVPS
jgi:hypothetical protein